MRSAWPRRERLAREAGVLLELLAKEEKRIAEGWVSAQEIAAEAATGEIAPTRVAAWTVVARRAESGRDVTKE